MKSTGRGNRDDTKAKLSERKRGKTLNLSDEERANRSARAKLIRSKMTDEQKAALVQKMLETKRLKASIKN